MAKMHIQYEVAFEQFKFLAERLLFEDLRTYDHVHIMRNQFVERTITN